MKKIALILIASLSLFPFTGKAQSRFTVGVGVGPQLSLSENAFSYVENKQAFGLLAPQVNIWGSYMFTNRLGLRLSIGGGDNASAKNTRESAGHGFYPYRFYSVNSFLDFLIDPRGKHSKLKSFIPQLYAGVGLGYTWGFRDIKVNGEIPYHWQTPTNPNLVFGFRGGFISNIRLSELLDLVIDLGLEAYVDSYNGVRPTEEDQKAREGYAGFPFDLRVPLTVGVRFKL